MILTKKGTKLSDTKKYTELKISIEDVSVRVTQQADLIKEVLLMLTNDKVLELHTKVNNMQGRISDIRDDIHEIKVKLENS